MNFLFRKSDIAINLATRRILRHDVEPFISFSKRISVNPSEAASIAFENVDKRIKSKRSQQFDTYVKYLEVNSIDFKQVTTKKVSEFFTCQLTRVERLKVEISDKNKGSGISSGDDRNVYYTLEVRMLIISIYELLINIYKIINTIKNYNYYYYNRIIGIV
jgi:hypothetical protein